MTNPLVPQYWRVTITAAGLTGTAPADGFIDYKEIEEYGRDTAYPSSNDLSYAKARANYRYFILLQNLAENQSITHVLNVDNGGATADAPGSEISFTLVYDREEYVYTYNELVDETGHPTEGVSVLQGADALKRQAARVWVSNYKSAMKMPKLYVPVSAPTGYEWVDEQISVETPLSGTLASKIDTAEANISVVQIANT